MYSHDRACACTGRTSLSLTLILGANTIYCKPKNLENVGLAGRDSEFSEDKVSIQLKIFTFYCVNTLTLSSLVLDYNHTGGGIFNIFATKSRYNQMKSQSTHLKIT